MKNPDRAEGPIWRRQAEGPSRRREAKRAIWADFEVHFMVNLPWKNAMIFQFTMKFHGCENEKKMYGKDQPTS